MRFADLDSTVEAAHSLYSELSGRYDVFVCGSQVSWKFLRRLGFRFQFNFWVEMVLALRHATTVSSQVLYLFHGADVSRSNDGSLVSQIINMFMVDESLKEFYRKAYATGAGDELELACLNLLVAGVKVKRVGLNVFLECVAAGVNVSQVEEFMVLPSGYRKALYAG